MSTRSVRSRRDDAPPGLFLSRDGDWFHDGDLVRHERLFALLSRSVARDETGRLVVTTGRDRLPFAAEDAPLLVRAVRPIDEALILCLSNGLEEPLVPGARVLIDPEGRLRSPVRRGRFWALWSRGAGQGLLARITEDGASVSLPGGRASLVPIDGPRDWSGLPATEVE